MALLRRKGKDQVAAGHPADATEAEDVPSGDDSPPGPFAGVLRSEFNQPSAVSPEFERVGEVTTLVANAYQRGLISAETAAEFLSGLVIGDDFDAYWRLGTATKRWYRKKGDGPWRVASPPQTSQASFASGVHEAEDVMADLLQAVQEVERSL